MKKQQHVRAFIMLFCLTTFSPISALANLPPVAKAGIDIVVTDKNNNGYEHAFLDGSESYDSDGTISLYQWQETSNPNQPGSITYSDTTFGYLAIGTHVYTLTVTDNEGATGSDSIIITVVPPVYANAGPDQTVVDTDNNGEESVILNGSVNAESAGTSVIYYDWQVNGNSVATGENPTVSLAVGTHVLTLIVTDDAGATDSDSVEITVNPGEQPPVADAGSDQTVFNGSRVTLEGAESYDPNDDVLSYSWLQTSGPLVTLSDSTVAKPTFTAPPDSTLIFELTVTANGESTSDSVTVISSAGTSGISVKPFLALPEPSGSMTVRLYPTENVQLGVSTLVTFGVPFTRGSITENDLSTVRVFNGTEEVPAYVEQLTPWRHLVSEDLDGASVRFARVQIQHIFSTEFPGYEEITVDWGTTERTASVNSLTDPRTAWHLVKTGSFDSADGIYEPDVYAVLPKEVLTKGVLSLKRMTPFADDVSEEREDPAEIKAVENWQGYEKLDHIFHNQLFTHINEGDPLVSESNYCLYKTESEPWLYDRASTMYLHYFRSGFLKPLREAVRSSQFYASNLYSSETSRSAAIGIFKLVLPDVSSYIGATKAMYSYNQCLAYTYWLLGDNSMLEPIEWVVQAHETHCEPTRWSPFLIEWTERHTAYRLLANLIAYEITGKISYKDNAASQVADFIWHQNGADGQAPTDGVDGGLYHYGSQHGDGDASSFVASPWMSVLTLDAMLRVYGLAGDIEVADFIRRFGTFLKASCKSDIYHYYVGESLLYPDYITTYDGTTNGERWYAAEHSLEVATSVAWAWYFSELLNRSDFTLKDTANELFHTYAVSADYWLRPNNPEDFGVTAYKINPWRKYSWQHLPSGSLSWIMNQSSENEEPTPPFANAGLDQAVVNGSLITLDGRDSFDPNGDVLFYSWQQIAGPEVILDEPTSATPSFTVPSDSTISFELTVNANGQSDKDVVNINSTSEENVLLFAEPIHAWLFEGNDNNMVINTANGNYNGYFDIPPSNPIKTTNGKVGNALEFDGIDDRVEIPDFDFYGDAFTLSLWMHLYSNDKVGTLFAKSNDQHRATIRLDSVKDNRALKVLVNTSATGGKPLALSSDVNVFDLNTWHHVAVVYNGSILKIFVDSIEVAATDLSGNIITSIATCALGNRTKLVGNTPINGMMDQVRIYNRALTSEEINILFNESSVVSTYAIWLNRHYPSLTGDEALPNADSNQNGVSNLLEYAFDIPFSGADVDQFLPKVGTYDDGTDFWVTLDWRQVREPNDLAYDVEYSYDLIEWSSIHNGEINYVQTTLDDDDDSDRKLSSTVNQIRLRQTRSKIFLRINVNHLND